LQMPRFYLHLVELKHPQSRYDCYKYSGFYLHLVELKQSPRFNASQLLHVRFIST